MTKNNTIKNGSLSSFLFHFLLKKEKYPHKTVTPARLIFALKTTRIIRHRIIQSTRLETYFVVCFYPLVIALISFWLKKVGVPVMQDKSPLKLKLNGISHIFSVLLLMSDTAILQFFMPDQGSCPLPKNIFTSVLSHTHRKIIKWPAKTRVQVL